MNPSEAILNLVSRAVYGILVGPRRHHFWCTIWPALRSRLTVVYHRPKLTGMSTSKDHGNILNLVKTGNEVNGQKQN